jgi:hypothetical protein
MEPTQFVHTQEENIDWTELIWVGMEAFNQQMLEDRFPVSKTSFEKMVAVKRAVYEDPSLGILLEGYEAAEKVTQWERANALITHDKRVFWELENELNFSRGCSFFSAKHGWTALVAKDGETYIVNVAQQACFSRKNH